MARIGRYELLRLLGRGGMAEVFLARRRGPGGVEKQLAVKRIRPERTGDPRFVEMFVGEARLSMALAHKNVVQVFDFGRIGDELFLVMEYVAGVDLGTALAALRGGDRGQTSAEVAGDGAAGALDPLLVAFIGMEACQALDHAHRWRGPDGDQDGIVHRDVTPRNVLLSVSGEVKLADFGVAGHITEMGGGRQRGTPAYMSPEQVRGEPLDGRSDVFSLGLVLWEALSGRRAYRAAEPADVLDLARAAEVPPLADSVPAALAAVVTRATAVERTARFSDARAMQLELDRFVVEARARSGGEPPSHRIAAWIRDLASTGREGPRGGAGDDRDLDSPAGEVVSFLADGADGVAGSLATSTVATVAESQPDEEASEVSGGGDDEGGAAAPDRPDAGRPDRAAEVAGSRSPTAGARWIAVAVTGLALAVTSWSLWGRSSSSPVDAIPTTAMSPAPAPRLDDDADPGARAGDAGAGARAGDADAGTRAGDAVVGVDVTPGSRRDAGPAVSPPDAAVPDPARRSTTPRSRRGGAESPRRPGTVKISATPWARVTVQGRSDRCSETPCVLSLPPGRHTLRLDNPVARLSKDISISVEAGATVVVNASLTTP